MADHIVHRRIPGWTREPLPATALDLARTRTAYLEGLLMREALQDLFAYAYIQGARDTLQALDTDRGRELLATPA